MPKELPIELPYEMTVNDFINKLLLIPGEYRDMPLELDVECGSFPSGEEGAEDWIMGSSFKNIEVPDTTDPTRSRQVVWLNVRYE